MGMVLNWFSWMNETHLRKKLTLRTSRCQMIVILTQQLANMHEPGTPDIL